MIANHNKNNCFNLQCQRPLQNGNNIGGWTAQKQKNGRYKNGYICKKCGNQSMPNTEKLALFQQTHHFATPQPQSYNAVTNKEIQHKREWSKLTASLTKDDEQTNAPNNTKMPKWNDVLNRMQKNDNISNKMTNYWKQKKEAIVWDRLTF